MNINDTGFNPFEQSNDNAKVGGGVALAKAKKGKVAKPKAKDIFVEDEPVSSAMDDKLIEMDGQQKQQLATSCNNYFNSKVFGSYLLKDCGFASEAKRVNKMDIDELKQLVKRLQTAVGLKNSGKATKAIAIKTIQAIETVLQPTPAKCPGTAVVLENSEEFNELIEELRLEMSLGVISAKTRLALLVIQTAYTQNVIARHVENNPDSFKKLIDMAAEAQAK